MNDARSEIEAGYEVAVVGAGPVGLSAAIELGLRGRRVLLLESTAQRGPQPRAKTLNMRSMLHFRRWGIADQIRAASPVPAELPRDVVFQTRLFGRHIATLPNIYLRGSEHDDDPRICELGEWIPQHVVESVLRTKLATIPTVRSRYGCELIDLEQQAGGSVRLFLREGGEPIEAEAQWVIGADGARSAVRERIGVSLTGRHAYACNYNLVLRIPELTEHPPARLGLMHWMINADSPVVMGPIGDLWYVTQPLAPDVSGMSEAEIAQCVTSAVGHPVEFEVVTVDPWYAHELIADRYRKGRVFLAGDACHLHPPFGGYGMNMGIADAVDIAWKLDAALAGWGGDALLDSYEFERRRVAVWTIDEAVENYRTLSRELLRPGLEADGPEGDALRARLADEIVAAKRREFHTIGLVLGYHYAGSPVMACAGAPTSSAPSAEDYEPGIACGVLAPHVVLRDGRPLYDVLGTGFSLIDTTDDRRAATPLLDAARQASVPLTHVRPEGEAVEALYGRRLVLVRPDQHIAWFGEGTDQAGAEAIIATVTGNQPVVPAQDVVESEAAQA